MNPSRVYPLVAKEIADHAERTISQIAEATGATRSGIRKVLVKMCDQQAAHVSRWRPCDGQPWNVEAIYCAGPGLTAPKPAQYVREPKVKEPATYPVPRPKLGLWGLVWNTTPEEGLTTQP